MKKNGELPSSILNLFKTLDKSILFAWPCMAEVLFCCNVNHVECVTCFVCCPAKVQTPNNGEMKHLQSWGWLCKNSRWLKYDEIRKNVYTYIFIYIYTCAYSIYLYVYVYIQMLYVYVMMSWFWTLLKCLAPVSLSMGNWWVILWRSPLWFWFDQLPLT